MIDSLVVHYGQSEFWTVDNSLWHGHGLSAAARPHVGPAADWMGAT